MTKEELAETLATAAERDYLEKPDFVSEVVTREGEEGIEHLISLDIINALRGEPGPAMFPHIRGAVRDMIALAKNELWMTEGAKAAGFGQLPGITMPMPAPVSGTLSQQPASSGDIFSTIAGIGSSLASVYTAKVEADSAKRVAESAIRSAQLQAEANRQAQEAQMLMMSRPGYVAPSSGMSPLLLIGGVAVLGVIAYMAFKK